MPSKKTIRRKGQKAGKVPIKKRGGQAGIPLTDRHKEKIRVSAILNRLETFVLDTEGDVEMAPHKVSAGLGLLSFALPKLQAVHNTEGAEKSHAEWLDELNREDQESDREGDEDKAEG